MKPTMSSFVVLLLLVVIATTNTGSCNASSYRGCIKSERQALLKFKQDLNDPADRLASWTADGDCCKWVGIHSDNFTGHILELHLRSSYDDDGYVAAYLSYNSSRLGGKITPALLDLKHLIYLDLSGNDFEGIQIPAFLSSMGNLRHLNLSYTGLIGTIPHQFGNLSTLQYLDLKQDLTHTHHLFAENFDLVHLDMLFVDNFRWLSDLHSLKHLDLGGVNLSKTFDQWLLVSNVLLSLEVLKLSKCRLHQMPPLFKANFSSLTSLDLSNNQFNYSLIPTWVFSLSRLVFLDLGGNNFQGPIPNEIQNLTSLTCLDLSANYFNSVPDSLYRISHLENLFLQENNLQGKLLDGLGNLTSIVKFDLSSNELEGKIPTSFGKLCNLKLIKLVSVKLSQDISEILDNLSQCVSKGLEILILTNNQLYGHLTNQLGLFKNLVALAVNRNLISGHVPISLGELSSLESLVLSYNQFIGSLSHTHFVNLTNLMEFATSGNSLTFELSPNWIPPFQLQFLKLTSCSIGPQFPSWILSQKKLLFLDIANSRIVDTIPNKFWKSSFYHHLNLSGNQIHGKIPNLVNTTSALESLDLSSNNFSGPLPLISSNVLELKLSNNVFFGSIFNFLCYSEMKRVQVLNLGNNLLYGELPECFMYWKDLKVLNLSKNKFFGKLPTSIGTLSYLQSLNLHRNNLFHTLPISLQNCTELVSLDLGENDFTGNVPSWMGEKFLNIMVLVFRSNNFHGPLPVELCRLAYLQILDLAYNNLSGTIPKCIGNLSAMVTVRYSEVTYVKYNVISSKYALQRLVDETVTLVLKGKVAEYNTILKLVKSIDLSGNNFSGKIPIEITNLRALVSLNLSHNSLTGKIPENIGVMTLLLCIDFSENQLSGEIPQSISNLTFLSILNLSNNNLVGKIPSGTQLQSFNESSFFGNKLCGLPLPKNCTGTGTTSISDHESRDEKDGSENEVNWFFVSMALGFVVGFWSVIGPLLVNRRWRYMYSRFLNGLGEKFASVVNKCC